MRILAITHLFPHEADTSNGVFIVRHLAELQRQGQELEVYVPLIWAPGIYRAIKPGTSVDHNRRLCVFEGLRARPVPYVRFPGMWFARWDGLALYLQMRRMARRDHQQRPFDIVYGICWMPECDTALRLARSLRIPAAGYAIGSDINVVPTRSRRLHRHTARIARALDATQAMGRSVADKIDAWREDRTLEVAGVVDLDEWKPVSDATSIRKDLGIPPDRLVLLYVGHLFVAKGLYELLEAVDRIRTERPDVLLKICGNGTEFDRLSAAIQERNLQSHVDIVGLVPPKRVRDWMQASDAFVLPSYTEGMPNVVMEAMACGLPVVATAVGGLPAALGHCDGAILVPPKDVAALQSAILTVIGRDDLRKRMGQAGRRKAQERFGVAPNARRVIDHLTAARNRYHKARVPRRP
ncbi:MAG: glycosyltransferase [Phycisphaerae bacterium]